MLDDLRDIAEQSSFLALNAAIEAARAGDGGRAFAEAAERLREMAQAATERAAADADFSDKAKRLRQTKQTEQIRDYELAMQRELSKISAVAAALEQPVRAAVAPVGENFTDGKLGILDKTRTEDLLALVEITKNRKSGIDAGLASDTIALADGISGLRQAVENLLDRNQAPAQDSGSQTGVDRGDTEMV